MARSDRTASELELQAALTFWRSYGLHMTPADIRNARQLLGLSSEGLARALNMPKGAGRTVRRWEAGTNPIPGPVAVLLTLCTTSPAIRDAFRSLTTEHPRSRT